MPVPLVLAAAAGATSTVAAGLSAAGGKSWFPWWFFNSKPPSDLTNDHQQSLDKQEQFTMNRIAEANDAVVSLQDAIEAIGISEAAESLDASSASIHQSSEQFARRVSAYREAGQETRECAAAVASLNPDLQALLERMQEENTRTATRLDALNDLLTHKNLEMERACRDIQTLTNLVEEQAETITILGDTVQKQQQTIITQAQQITDLKGEAKRSSDHCKFFKQIALEAKAQAQVAVVSNGFTA